MLKLKMSQWLLSAAAVMGAASASSAQDAHVQQADAIFNARQQPLVQQISGECDTTCDLGCTDPGCCDGGCGLFGGGDCDSCYLFGGDGFDLSDSLFGEDAAWDVGGWFQMGYSNRDTGLFNSNPDRLNIHQTWLYAEKAADGSEGFDWGGRIDVMYGTDADDTQAFGNNPGRWDFANGFDRGAGYGWAIPQLYAEVAYNNVSVKAGHFYTLLGYEVVTAPDNFFYSHAFTMYNSEAFTHTGVLATVGVSDDVEVYAGWTLGWDTGFDQFAQGNSFLGGASLSLTDELSLIFITTVGDFGAIGPGYSHSIVLDYAVTEKLNYVFQSDFLRANGNAANGSNEDRDTVGINQYLIYSISDCWGVGGRAEWWKADGTSYYSITGGVNYKPMANLVIRPEVRYQWSPAANDGNPVPEVPVDEGAIFGIDAILTF